MQQPIRRSPSPMSATQRYSSSAVSSSAASFKTAASSVHTVTYTSPLDDAQHIGPPPPSPPASVDKEEVELSSPPRPSVESKSSHQTLRPIVTAGTPLTLVESPFSIANEAHLQPPQPMPQPQQSQASSSTAASQHPGRPTRRNTTGSTPSTPKQRRFVNPQQSRAGGSQHTFAFDDSAVVGLAVENDGSVELAEDIELHADQIRRERMSKRWKQQQQEAAEATLSRQGSKSSQDRPLVGNLIGEGHVNYVLMYNMLTGIRVGVSNAFFQFVYWLRPHRYRDAKRR